MGTQKKKQMFTLLELMVVLVVLVTLVVMAFPIFRAGDKSAKDTQGKTVGEMFIMAVLEYLKKVGYVGACADTASCNAVYNVSFPDDNWSVKVFNVAYPPNPLDYDVEIRSQPSNPPLRGFCYSVDDADGRLDEGLCP